MIDILRALWLMRRLAGLRTVLGQLPYIPYYYAIRWNPSEEIRQDLAPSVTAVLFEGVKQERAGRIEADLERLGDLATEVGEIDAALDPAGDRAAFRARALTFWAAFRLLFPDSEREALDIEFGRRLDFIAAGLETPERPWCVPSPEFNPGDLVWVPLDGKAQRGRVAKAIIELWQEEERHADDVAYSIDVAGCRIQFCEADVFSSEEGAQALAELRWGIKTANQGIQMLGPNDPRPPGGRRVS